MVFIVYFLLALNPLCKASENLEKKSLFWTPLASIFLPGFGQEMDDEHTKSILLAGQGISGILIASNALQKQVDYNKTPVLDENYQQDIRLQLLIGGSMYTNAGLLSAFDVFNSRLKAYQAEGKFEFLPHNQNLTDLYKAPFHFSYLKKSTTWIPFLIAMGLGYEGLMSPPHPNQIHARGIDGAAGAYLSYNAGTGEEAYFRGALYPTLYESWNGHWTANATQALVFGYMHGPEPYPQILAGWYLGWLAEKNGFDLGEGIFVHAWWDFWVITANFIKNRSYANELYIQLPQVDIRF
jgi:hypothetical protein